MKGYLNGISSNKINSKNILNLIILNKNSFEICYKLITILVINDYFLNKLDTNEINEINLTLNLQWAIDLKKELDQIPN